MIDLFNRKNTIFTVILINFLKKQFINEDKLLKYINYFFSNYVNYNIYNKYNSHTLKAANYEFILKIQSS